MKKRWLIFLIDVDNLMSKQLVFVMIGIFGSLMLAISAFALSSDTNKDGGVKGLDENNFADSIVVTIITGNEKLKLDTFLKIGFVKSKNIEFLLESTPGKDKKPYYKIVEKSLSSSQISPTFIDINVDVVAGDGSIIETLQYKRCTIVEYFVYISDSKGKLSFLESKSSKMEIREVSKFACNGLSISA